MRVVVVDPDVQFAELVADRLGEDGHDVACAGNPQQLEALLRARPADAVLLDLSRRRMNGFELARDLRRQRGPDLEIVLVAPIPEEDDPEISALMDAVDARAFYEKPVDLDDLAENLVQSRVQRRKAPVAQTKPAPRPVTPSAGARPRSAPRTPRRKSVHWDNARELMNLWARRLSGRLEIAHGDKGGQVILCDGGVVDPTAVPLIELALDGGSMEFHEEAAEGMGDWALLGNQVFVRCRSACEENTVLGYMSARPTAVDQTEMARALAITGPTRRMMGSIDGEFDLAHLLERCQAVPSEVSSDLEALVQLHLLELRRGPPVAEVSAEGSPDVEISEKEEQAFQQARSSSDLDGLPTIDHGAIASAHQHEDAGKLLTRLQREFETVQNASPPVALGVPADSSPALVDEAASRMRDRYTRLSQDGGLPDEVRELAGRIGQVIRQAHRHFGFKGATGFEEPATPTQQISTSDRLEILLEQGRKFIARGEWSAADAILSEAHRDQLDHAGILSNLGWARLHNPNRDEEERTEEGRDFLLLGEQFDPHHVDGQYFLAQFMLASRLLEAAEARARRARDAAPGEPARNALYRKIQIKLAEQVD